MRIAVVTPCHNPDPSQFEQCKMSVQEQTFPCTHILVDDGSSPPLVEDGIIRLPQAHADTGNAARSVGSVTAICQGYDAIAYLDADNWYEPMHIESLVALHYSESALVCSSTRNLYTMSDEILGVCPEIDGETFVDTSCMFITRAAFGIIPAWFLMPPALKLRGDRFVWDQTLKHGIRRAHSGLPTVNYRTRYLAHYKYFGKHAPAGAQELVLEDGRYVPRR